MYKKKHKNRYRTQIMKFGKKEKPDQRKIGFGKDQRHRSTKTVQRGVKREQDSKDQEADRHGKGHQNQ